MNIKNYVVGIDVGESGIGKVAIEIDNEGNPLSILNSVVTIIDGGKSPDSGKTPRSRKMMGGVARRTRRLVKRRAQRILRVSELLDSLNITDSSGLYQDGVTYEPWMARAALYQEFEPNETKRLADLRLAILHIARHRGWRNPWWTYSALESKTTAEPTAEFLTVQSRAAKILGVAADLLPTVGAIGAKANHPSHHLRPRALDMTKAADKSRDASEKIIVDKLFQLDLLRELKAILNTQKVDPQSARQICELVFGAVKPKVNPELVGKDPLNPNKLRAPKASLEFQEFRIRDAISNLRFKDTKQPLSVEEKELVIERLNNWSDPTELPSWSEIADWIGHSDQNLSFAISDVPDKVKAHVNRTHLALMKLDTKGDKSEKRAGAEIKDWYLSASQIQRSQFALFLGDSTDESDISEIEDFIEGLSDDQQNLLDSLEDIQIGRAAYSVDTLNTLNKALREGAVDLNAALMQEFNRPSGWKPDADSIFEPVDHPVVDQVLTDVGRWLNQITDNFGPPTRVNVEHVRSAFLGPEALSKHNTETNSNRREREQARKEIAEQLHIDVRAADPRRYTSVKMQNGQCLYCGGTITYQTCELDHIVPRAEGGSNRRENLVAVCRRCNNAKGKLPFAVWAKSTDYASVEAAVARVNGWLRPTGKGQQSGNFKKLQTATKFRLKRTELDDDLDERALASTAYAALEVRVRIKSFLEKKFVDQATGEVWDAQVDVYRGSITAAARKTAGIERRTQLRGANSGLNGKGKSRFDRRHHAMDAATVAMLNPSVLQILGAREEMRAFDREGSSDDIPTWKKYKGKSTEYFDKWVGQLKTMSDLFNEQLEADRVVVMRQLRLGANQGSLHDDTVKKLIDKSTDDGLHEAEVLRIVDPALYQAIQPVLKSGALPPISERPATGTIIDQPGALIKLFPAPRAMLEVRNGAVAIGTSLHHLRIYALPKKSGGYEFKQVRVFSGEFGRIGFRKKGVDLFTEPLPIWSESIRCANPKLREAITSGEAKQIGWLVAGDELEFSPNTEYLPIIPPIDGVTNSELIETRWTVSGANNEDKVNLFPTYLAREGITSGEIPTVLDGNYWRAALNQVMLAKPTIIRRTAAGRPRWKDNGDGMPISWSVGKALAELEK